MKRYILALVLTIGFIPQHAQAVQLNLRTNEPGILVQTYEPLKAISAPAFKPAQPLSMATFHIDPMGSHSNDYVPGQCTWGAASMKGNIPNWGNANTWDDGARAAGLTVSDQPIVGAIAQTDRGYYGHVAVVTEVFADHITIQEMNYDGLGIGSVRTRAASYGEFVYIWI